MKKSEDNSQKYIAQLSEFFLDSRELPRPVLQDIAVNSKNAKYLKQSIRRLVARGLIEPHPTKYVLTKEGERFFHTYYPTARAEGAGKWDGKWRIVSFDVPGEYRIERQMIRGLLKAYNFYRLHKSVWASPGHLSQDFWKSLVRSGLHEYCKVMLVEILEGDKELQEHFDL